MRKILSLGGVATLAALFLVLFTSTSAFAHEKRHVGKYTFVVGFLNEPAYAQQANSLDLTICNGDACNYTVKDGSRVVANPVNDADKMLKAEVIQGGSAPLSLTIEPRYANPGKYNGYFMPSTTGTYSFHIFGTLEGNKIDEKFTSSPTTFEDVEALKAYPATNTQQAAPAPNTAALQAQLQDAQNSAASARTFGIIGTILGLIGVAAAAVALTRKPAAAKAAPASPQETADSLRG